MVATHAERWNHYFERLEKLASKGEAGTGEWAWAPESLDRVVAADAALAAAPVELILHGWDPGQGWSGHACVG